MSRRINSFLVGIAVGILLAPDKGSTTRKRIADSFSDLVGNAQDKAGELADRITDTAKDVRDDVKGAAKDVSNDVKSNWS